MFSLLLLDGCFLRCLLGLLFCLQGSLALLLRLLCLRHRLLLLLLSEQSLLLSVLRTLRLGLRMQTSFLYTALLFFTLHLAAMRNEILRRRVRTMLMMQADAAARP